MVAPDDVDEEMYIRHLALFVSWVLPIILTINSCSPLFLQRKFARLSENDKTATCQVFRQWLGEVSEEEWKILMDEDQAFDYANRGVGREEENIGHETAENRRVGRDEENIGHERIETEIISGDDD